VNTELRATLSREHKVVFDAEQCSLPTDLTLAGQGTQKTVEKTSSDRVFSALE
jgi:hypothetical protein